MESACANKGDFGLSAEFFDGGFAFGSAAAIRLNFVIDQFAGRTGMKEPRTAALSLVLLKATLQIRGYTGIEITVGCLDDVNVPVSLWHQNRARSS